MPGSTRSSAFPDINVWLALTYDRHEHHVVARRWLDTVDTGGRLFFCRLTQLGLLRLLSSEPVMGRDEVMNQPAAWEAYDRWRSDDRVGFLDEPADLEAALRALTRLRHPAPKDWADSYLAAFASAARLTVVTFDRALQGKCGGGVLLKA